MCGSFTQRKVRADRVPFYTEKRFYYNIDMILVTAFPRHPYLKKRIGSRFEKMSCNCLYLQKEDPINVKSYILILIFQQTRKSLEIILRYRQRWTLYQLIHTSKKWIACCFFMFTKNVSRYNVHSINRNIFLWWKKNPLWIWGNVLIS